MESSLKVALINLALLILVFGFLFRLDINIISGTDKNIAEANAKLVKFQEDIADLRLELSNIKQSMESALIPITESISRVQKESEQSITDITNAIERIEKENTQSISGLRETVKKVSLDKDDISLVAQDAMPAVVSIKTDMQQGTGFFVSGDGFVLTNAHLLTDNSFVKVVTFDHKTYFGQVVGIDVPSDIALLKINSDPSQFLRLGDSDSMAAGDDVIAIGNPGGFDFSVSKGVISSTDRQNKHRVDMFQMDISINPGNSGGPLINRQGLVVGMNSGFIYTPTSLFERLGFAIKSNYIKNKVNGWQQGLVE